MMQAMNRCDITLRARDVAARLCLLCAALVTGVLLSSCASSSCAYCDYGDCPPPDAYMYSVELRDPVADPCSGELVLALTTPYQPSLLCEVEQRVLRVDVPCAKAGDCEGSAGLTIPEAAVLRVLRVSDTKTHPQPVALDCRCKNCEAARDGLLVFDKVELRAMGAYRGDQTAVFYPDAAGGVLYEPETFGTGRGGTSITVGAEAALLWEVVRFGGTHAFHLGPLVGVWPVDGSTFIPVSLHPRITFNNRPDPYGCNCNAWYLFGDLGVTFDGTTGAPIAEDRRIWLGLGIGYEIPVSKQVDLGADLFVRRTWLPLPPLECCPDIPADERNPVRISNLVGLRFGVTF